MKRDKTTACNEITFLLSDYGRLRVDTQLVYILKKIQNSLIKYTIFSFFPFHYDSATV